MNPQGWRVPFLSQDTESETPGLHYQEHSLQGGKIAIFRANETCKNKTKFKVHPSESLKFPVFFPELNPVECSLLCGYLKIFREVYIHIIFSKTI